MGVKLCNLSPFEPFERLNNHDFLQFWGKFRPLGQVCLYPSDLRLVQTVIRKIRIVIEFSQ